MHNKTKTAIATTIFITFAILVFEFYWDIVFSIYPVDSLIPNSSTSMSIHKIFISDKSGKKTTFCVPEAYLKFKNNFGEESGIGINLEMNIDSFKPWNIFYENFTHEYQNNRNTLTYKDIKEIRKKSISISIKNGSGRTIDKIWSTTLNKPNTEQFGEYIRITPQKNNHLVPADYLLIPQGAIDYSKIVLCNNGALCSEYSEFSSSIRYELIFPETELKNLNTLTKRSIDLIQSLICQP